MRFLYILVFFISYTVSKAQTDFNLELQSHIDWAEGGSGCWGHTDSRGIEYAIMGTRMAIRILSLEDPKNPKERLVIPGTTNNWREARGYGDFLYITTESQDGITIVDLTKGPDSMQWKRWKPFLPDSTQLNTVHSINMDDFGFMYINGSNVQPRGVIIFDTKPNGNEPKFISKVGTFYTHDCFATKDRLYTCDLSNGVGIYDIQDRSKPIFLNRFATTVNFVHNAWTTIDEKILFTTDERSGAYVESYDVSDPLNVKYLTQYRNPDSKLGSVIPHNVYIKDNWAITSWYTDGILVKDISHPDNIVKVGSYDTYLNEATLNPNTTWFEGCWGVYPYFKSGTIIASDINTGLYVLKPNYTRACYLEGKAFAKDTDGNTTPITGATISIRAIRNISTNTDQSGSYKTGVAEAGNYVIYFQHGQYPKDSAIVTLTSGEVTTYNFIISTNSVKGTVRDVAGEPIPNVKLQYFLNPMQQSALTGNAQGGFSFPFLNDSIYTLRVAAWGYKPQEITVSNLDPLLIVLQKGYEDNFMVDLGWTNPVKAVSGNWERAIPQGTVFQNNICNANSDVSNDIGEYAYVTGNGGNNPGDRDVDNGGTLLVSPIINATGADTMHLSYSYWFYNAGGNSTPNDTLHIILDNGSKKYIVEKITISGSEWKSAHHAIVAENLSLTQNMTLSVSATDYSPGNLVEGGLDDVKINFTQINTDVKDLKHSPLVLYPNPIHDQLTISGGKVKSIVIYDALGRRELTQVNANRAQVGHLTSGFKIVEVVHDNGTQVFKIYKN